MPAAIDTKSISAAQAISVALIGLAAFLPCAYAERSSSDVVRPPDVSSIKPEVLDRWLSKNCHFRGPKKIYEACVRTVASRLPPFDKSKPDHFGELYSPGKYVDCRIKRGSGDSGCERLVLRRKENPIYWPNAKIPFPKLPDAPKEDVYRPWMTKTQYFEALCKAEAGEFIYKTVEGVEGVYQIRPRAYDGNDLEQEDRYVIEDPNGYEDWEAQQPYGPLVNAKLFGFFEAPNASSGDADKKFLRYTRLDPAGLKWDVVPVPTLDSRHGFFWRGLKRTRDREHNIAGGELVIVDLRSAEILAVRRSFILGGPIRRSHSEIFWKQGRACKGQRTGIFRTAEFIERVLKPAKQGKS